MKILIEKNSLEGILQKVSGGVSNKNTPALSSVLIESLEKKVRVTATDLELTIFYTQESEVEEKGSICVPFKSLLSLTKGLPEGKVDIKATEDKMWIKCGKCEYILNGFHKQNFPKVSTSKEKQIIRVNSEELQEMIRLTNFCAFTGESNYVLSGILFELEKDKLKLVATDGKRLSLTQKKFPREQAPLTTKISFIVPLKTMNEVGKALREAPEIYLGIGKKQVDFEIGNLQINSRIIEGEFPAYEKYIPQQQSENPFTADRDMFLSALRRASILSTSEHMGIKIELAKNQITISQVTPQIGEYKEVIDAEYSGKAMVIGFNPEYLIDILRNSQAGKVTFDVYEPDKPVVLRGAECTYLALPMRLS